MNFPVFSQLAGNFGPSETSSLLTASSSAESCEPAFPGRIPLMIGRQLIAHRRADQPHRHHPRRLPAWSKSNEATTQCRRAFLTTQCDPGRFDAVRPAAGERSPQPQPFYPAMTEVDWALPLVPPRINYFFLYTFNEIRENVPPVKNASIHQPKVSGVVAGSSSERQTSTKHWGWG